MIRHRQRSADSAFRVVYLLLPKFSMTALILALEPLRVANVVSGRALYEWKLISLDGNPVSASNGMTLPVDSSLISVDADLVLVCSSFEPEAYMSRQLMRWLRQCDAVGSWVGGMDTGPIVLAEAGLLDNHQATVHWECLAAFQERYSAVRVQPVLFVVDRGRLTCAGGTASMDLMLHVMASQHGDALAASVSEQFICGVTRRAEENQRSKNHDDPSLPLVVQRALRAMEARIEDPQPLGELCEGLGVSPRQLTRLFVQSLGRSPHRHHLELRLERAKSLLLYSDLSVIQISVACGFNSVAHFSRSYRSWSGTSPSLERRSRQPRPPRLPAEQIGHSGAPENGPV